MWTHPHNYHPNVYFLRSASQIRFDGSLSSLLSEIHIEMYNGTFNQENGLPKVFVCDFVCRGTIARLGHYHTAGIGIGVETGLGVSGAGRSWSVVSGVGRLVLRVPLQLLSVKGVEIGDVHYIHDANNAHSKETSVVFIASTPVYPLPSWFMVPWCTDAGQGPPPSAF
ncbi:hypothetical protein D9758_017137 [Tetrapyrgos nigripes]|uniref:Uncharacterized protein n=1 Tax=Tetrapyrgos nigripes TaxID=182062 RepID=A0A8H5BIV0_9AGAR|nr:hypothetical protein D9758_017137 [Tetrapyrgos nigripes]